MPAKRKRHSNHFLNNSIKEMMLRDRILVERPDLESLYEFKFHTKDNNYSEKDWEKLYEQAFNEEIAKARIPEEDITTVEKIHEGCVCSADKTMQTYKALFGPKPLYVKDWVGKVFTTNIYEKFYPKMDAGSFTDDEFTLLSYMGFNNPAIVYDGQNADVSHMAVAWAVDSCKFGIPRDTILVSFSEKVYAPARTETQRLIREYDNGNKQPMVDFLTKGIKSLMLDNVGYESLIKNYQVGARQLKQAVDLLERKPDLKEAVLANFTEKEKNQINALINVGIMAENREIAIDALTKHSRGEAEYTDEEILNYKKQIVAIEDLSDTWNRRAGELRNVPNGRTARLQITDLIDFASDPEKVKEYLDQKTEKAANYNFVPATKPFVSQKTKMDNAIRYRREYYEGRMEDLEEEQKEVEKKFTEGFDLLKTALSKKKAGTKEYKEAKEKLDAYVDERIRELERGYQMRRISDHYVIERTAQLNALKANPSMKKPELPSFADPSVRRNDEFLKDICSMELCYIIPPHLKNLATFVKWTIEESKKAGNEPVKLEDHTDEEWKSKYEAEVLKELAKKPLRHRRTGRLFDPEKGRPKKAEEFLNDSVKDQILRESILRERPYLVSLYEFKIKEGAESGVNHSEEEWQKLYEEAFSKAVDEDRIPEEITVSRKDFLAGIDTPADKNLKMYTALFGAEPVFMPEWVNKNVYTVDNFKEICTRKNPGSFSNEQFAILSYYASQDEDVVKGNRFPKNDGIDHKEYVCHVNPIWSSNSVISGDVRENTINHFGKYAVLPGREETEKNIALFDNGNIEPLAHQIAKGMQYSVRDASVPPLKNGSANFTACTYLLRDTMKLLEERPQLKESVMEKLSLDDKERIDSLIQFGKLVEAKRVAENALNDAAHGKKVLTDEEKLEYKKQIVAAEDAVKRWDDKDKEIEQSDLYVAHQTEFNERIKDPTKVDAAVAWDHSFKIEQKIAKTDTIRFLKNEEELNRFVQSKEEEAKAYQFKTWEIPAPITAEEAAQSAVLHNRPLLEEKMAEYEKKAKDLDKEFNKEFAEYKNELGKYNKQTEQYAEAKENLDLFVDGRLRRLEDSYQKREISEHYYVERAAQLNELKANPSVKTKEIPGFTDADDEKNKEYLAKVSMKKEGTLFGEHLKSVAAFAEWRVKESAKIPGQEITLDEFSDEEWELMYQNELSRAAEKNPLTKPDGVEIPKMQTQEEKEAANHKTTDKEVSDYVKEKYINEGKEVSNKDYYIVQSHNQRKLNTNKLRMMMPEYINKMVACRKENTEAAANEIEFIENTMCNLIAKPIAMGIIERHGEKVPGGMTEYVFAKRLGEDKEFKEVVKPLIREVCDQVEQMRASNPKAKVLQAPKAKRLIEMVNDRSILNAFALQARSEKSAKTQNANNLEQNGNEANAPKKDTAGIKHAKEQLKKKPSGPAI